MTVTKSARSRLTIFIENITRTGLRYSIPVAAITTAYLLYIVFGPKLSGMGKMDWIDRSYLAHTVAIAQIGLRVSVLVLVLSLALRFIYDAIIGQILTLAGGILYFLSGSIFGHLTVGVFANNTVYLGIVDEFTRVGLTALVPGAILLTRDIGTKVIGGIRSGKKLAQLWGDEELRLKRHAGRKLYERCWDMPFCREFVRNVCPAWRKSKPCWRVKCGCYCDEQTILNAMTADASNNELAKGFMRTLRSEPRPVISAKQKRARCRRCIIYSEHQRQKYRILSTAVFPAVALAFWLFKAQLYKMIAVVYTSTDRFVSFVTAHPQQTLGGEQHVFTILAMIWLWIVVLSYTLRAVEYLIFDLQV